MRQWRESDFVPFSEINADPQVMRFFPSTLTTEETMAQAQRVHAYIEKRGWGFWAVEEKATGQFIGFVGLHHQDEDCGIPNAPLVEIGWRLSSKYWGQGFAPEAARAALAFAFNTLALPAVYAFTALPNIPSKRVMEKIGMANTGNDFDHPKLPKDHALARHCLYKITKEEFEAQ
ncbi:GNAT family N-acetyltransferase [Photobacterium sanctipauli]|uniref:GNAT family N-acetyltransferase n=1 Tax=Photobacterium sanctipauli TaxID=1342794 RepID=UPI00055A5E74|nr:GNAT family N-acetyltransferase [Photobacterium sanctipauli]